MPPRNHQRPHSRDARSASSAGRFLIFPASRWTISPSHFDHAPGTGHDDKFEAVSSVYRLRQSRCFLESGGKLECATCHDPHQRSARRGGRDTHYSGVCLQCHAARPAAHPAGVTATATDCITCHMPKRRVEDAPHVIMTDHLIQRRAPANALAEFAEKPAEEYRGEVVPYYPSPLPETPRNALYRAVAQVGLGNNVAAGMPELVRLIDGSQAARAGVLHGAGRWLEERWASRNKPRRLTAARSNCSPIRRAPCARWRQWTRRTPRRFWRMRFRARAGRCGIVVSLWRADGVGGADSKGHRARSVAAGSIAPAGGGDPFRSGARGMRCAPIRSTMRRGISAGRIMAEKGEFAEAFFDFERAIKLPSDALVSLRLRAGAGARRPVRGGAKTDADWPLMGADPRPAGSA